MAKPIKVEIDDSPTNVDLGKLNFQAERILTGAATYQYDLSSLIGHVLYPQKVNGRCGPSLQPSYDAGLLSQTSYLKPDIKLELKSANNVLYDSKTDQKAAGALKIFAFAGSITSDQVAQVTITDAAFLVTPTNGLADGWEARALGRMTTSDCTPILINGAKTRVATYRFARKTQKKSGLIGWLFGANGHLYVEDGRTATEVVIAVDPIVIREPVAGLGPETEGEEDLPHIIHVKEQGFGPHK